MNRQTLHHGDTTRHHLWLCLALALGLALGTRAATARECARETPLPTDVHLIAPGPEVPEAVARFAEAWIGASVDQQGSDVPCHTLVVEEVLANGYARVIFSYGTSAALHVPLPGFLRVTGRIIDGTLRFRLPIPERPNLAYQFAGETLQSTFQGESRVSLTRVADLHQVGCGPPPAPPATGPRARLTAAELLASADPSVGLVHNAYFMPLGQATPALHAFKGTVTIQASTMFRGRHGCAGLAEPFTGFTVAFFTHGEHLVPVVRDILQPPGTLILSPGRVWSEPGDGGLSRASFPFVLTFDAGGHHGLATFLYDDTRVSALRFQVVQEHDPFAKDRYDGWGQVPMTYTPGPSADEEVLWAQFAAELQQQTPMRPWSALPVATGSPWLEGFDGDSTPTELKASGLIVDGVVYLRGCETRTGPYPYCRHMRHFVRSMSKSLGAGLALLWLAQRYGRSRAPPAPRIASHVALPARPARCGSPARPGQAAQDAVG